MKGFGVVSDCSCTVSPFQARVHSPKQRFSNTSQKINSLSQLTPLQILCLEQRGIFTLSFVFGKIRICVLVYEMAGLTTIKL